MQPGQAGAVLMAGFVFLMGLGFANEGRDALDRLV
jgi:hypothetical protein